MVAAPGTAQDSPLDSGDGYPIYVNGGLVISYGSSGMVESLSGTENTLAVSSMSSVAAGSYLVFLAGGAYYAVKMARSATAVCSAFPSYGANAYGIYAASSIVAASSLFAEGGLYAVSSFNSVKTILSGSFSAQSGTHVGGSGGGNPGR